MNKIEKELDNGLEFINKISSMLREFDVTTLKARPIPYTTRKDGNKSIKIILDINNKFENLINLFGNVGFRYCEEREKFARIVFGYLSMKKTIVDKRKALYRKAQKLKKEGLQLSEIHKRVGNKYVTKKNLWLWIHKAKEQNIQVPLTFPNFDDWLKHSTKGLNDGLIWETIDSIQGINNRDRVCDITTNPTHTFFANGFLVSNCGREDIDARCLAWRPFVFELETPEKRKLNLGQMQKEVNKSKKVKIRGLRISNKREVVRVKEIRPDKTYKMVVSLKKKPSSKDLQSLKTLVGIISQKTPTRVLHRRADLLRKRRVKQIKARMIKNKLHLEVRGEAGLYVKELVTGDSGRTTPSVTSLLGPAVVKELDVVRIHLKRR